MLESVKDTLNKDITVDSVKEVLLTEVNVRALLEKEIEIQKLKELLMAEIKLKEFLMQEIDVKRLFSAKNSKLSEPDEKVDSGDSLQQEISVNQAQSTQANNNEPIALSRPIESPPKVKFPVEPVVSQVAEQLLELPLKELLPPFDRHLINTMKKEHKEILITYNELMQLVEAEEYAAASKTIAIFGSKLRNHYYQAERTLYVYLKKYVQFKYPKRERAFRDLNLELKNLSIEVFYANSQSPNIPVNMNNRERFLEEYAVIGTKINTRIHKEKTILFVMYEESNEPMNIS